MPRGDEKEGAQRPPAQQPTTAKGTTQQPTKPLRFVTNYGSPHPKRRRIGAACLTCRRRKTACSGERPYCDTCKQNKLDCAGYSAETAATPSHKRSASDASTRRPSEQEVKPGPIQARRPLSPYARSRHGSSNDISQTRTTSGGRSPRTTATESKAQSTDETKAGDGQDSLFSGPRNRMPYFRWLGPTAILPGFKQMVVKVKRSDTDAGWSSTNGEGLKSPCLTSTANAEQRATGVLSNGPNAVEVEQSSTLDMPFYDTSPMPPSELITHLAKTFFTHLGCNYPFLQRERFLRDLVEKQVDAILVDAVCALAARFSTHPLLTQATGDGGNAASPAEYGHAFAQRAKTSLTDIFPCPTIAAAQAALLLAYNEFGEQRDSGLWMYLGISIRLAQDLGLHKLEGLRYVGRDGPTPKAVKWQAHSGSENSPIQTSNSAAGAGRSASKSVVNEQDSPLEGHVKMAESRAVEQERVDTFWAIFFLDRVVSSGTGRRSTLRDKDIELSFPSEAQADSQSPPPPFPALIRIVHLYGRVADLLNSLKEPSDITTGTSKRLAAMESQVTHFYQGLSSKLHFNAMNFQHYMRVGEGTNFVLLHFWFHTLIIMLHQPTLLKTFNQHMIQLFPNSQQLAMSSAKTIADILAYSQLVDAKASLGNPFTSQPIYIAACAFLRETVEQTATSNAQSRAASPVRSRDATSDNISSPSTENLTHSRSSKKDTVLAMAASSTGNGKIVESVRVSKTHVAKHTLLATAATQHYQLCYKALQSLETYWAGAKYILTVLNQKFEGVGDPLLYTVEEEESSMEQPKPEPAFTSPGWRRKLSWGTNVDATGMSSTFWSTKAFGPGPGKPSGVDPSKAIGWTLTGDMNSSSTNLAWHYAAGQNSNLDPRLSSSNTAEASQMQNSLASRHLRADSASAQRLAGPERLASEASQEHVPRSGNSKTDTSSLGAPSPFSEQAGMHSPATTVSVSYRTPQGLILPPYGTTDSMRGMANLPSYTTPGAFQMGPAGILPMNFLPGDMMIESQDVDMSMLGLDMMPWFDSCPIPEMMDLFDQHHATGGAEGAGHGAGAQHGQR
ncbi:hypothetical protein DOTSEDRAFT_69339 [Dothistroma septosporum NZE10]|uniref:Zn(2)-C6 fungal-type domain-containing protein n=1 Tax=Dothistroma septosporum (strain NZE10 / CBS 128990) TaxID=675120 RepID=N1PVG5_DOTSN|nr:hypothetical protein DOTSEDRAFT_69339 [Dothistroma septosporum NZE10]